jgi:hypothetical protein
LPPGLSPPRLSPSAAIAQEGQSVAHGEQSISGKIAQVQAAGLAVRPSGGHAMTLQTGAQTVVRIDGRQASIGDLHAGDDARVAYQLTGPTPTALTIDVARK